MEVDAEGVTSSLQETVSQAVWEIVKTTLPQDSRLRSVNPPLLDLNRVRKCLLASEEPSGLLCLYIARVYKAGGVNLYSVSLFEKNSSTILKKVDELLEGKQQKKTDPNTLKGLKRAFCLPFSGSADAKFHNHLMRCCKCYETSATTYASPYVTIMQSSGFGKSRIVYQVATKIAESKEELPEGKTLDARLLYVCARNTKRSTGFPQVTPKLSEFFFRDENMADRLLVALEYACANWESAKTDWLGLFGVTDQATDDATLAEALEEADKSRRESEFQLPPAKKQRSPSGPVVSDGRVKVLVLAIDEAGMLLDRKNADKVSYFRLLRRALVTVNEQMEERKAMVFAVLVDTTSKIDELVPPLSKDTSLRVEASPKLLFPPFVLTHTMDVMTNSLDYKAIVLEDDQSKIWDAFVSMGRPLWHSVANTKQAKDVISFAASKLLCGLVPSNNESYEEKGDVLQGVSSLLCRLGLRPQANSALATQAVAELMAVLHYVTYKHDEHFCGYVTEPVLAFGATHLWYEVNHTSLERYILPQFRQLLMQGVVDVGGIGELTTRIFLLLAMDATIRKTAGGDLDSFSLLRKANVYTGQLCSVKSFLELLGGSCWSRPQGDAEKDEKDDSTEPDDNGPVLITVPQDKNEKLATTDNATPEQRKEFNAWMEGWEDWGVGFSHFVELTAMPTKATLWFLLGRRAAGVFPRNQKGADLLIPIVCKRTEEVSFMLVQVKKKGRADAEFPQSATEKLTPANLFKKNQKNRGKHELSKFSPRQVIRVFVSLRESNKMKPAQSYLIGKSDNSSEESYSLCLRGPCRRLNESPKASLKYWPFLLSEHVSDLLAEITDAAWWKVSERVDTDLSRRALDSLSTALQHDMPDEEVQEAVGYTLKFIPYVEDSGRGMEA